MGSARVGVGYEERSGTLDDGDLIRRILNREEAALELIMEKYSTRVFSAAFRILHQRSEAQDVTQDVFFALWRSPERFDAVRGPVVTWLVILSRSRALDVLRRLHWRGQNNEPALEVLKRGQKSIQTPAFDLHVLTEELLERLPAEQGYVVEKAYIEGYALAEIASLLGVPLGTIKGRARIALKKLRRELGAPPGWSVRLRDLLPSSDPNALLARTIYRR